MHIVVEPSDYVMRNIGDMAMLQAAVARMAEHWPDARIDVFTDDPEGLVRLAPRATPVSSKGRRIWLQDEGRETLGRIGRRLPIPPQDRLRFARPGVWFKVKQFMLRLRGDSVALTELEKFHSLVTRADLVIVTGMGGVTDAFSEFATGLLDTLALATHAGRYTAMIGQGFGPLEDPQLRALASAVLPRVDLIAVREERASVPLLLSLGVSRERIVVTGDDTLEPAYRIRTDHLGDEIGVNLRIADYAGVGTSIVPAVQTALGNVARHQGAELVPVPISRVPGEADLDSIRMLIGDTDTSAVEGSDRPEDAMRMVHRCRVVVTGSYHSAVFALASGVPAVGLAGSPYYEDKFKGLSDLFGDGCQTLMVDEPDLAGRLEQTTEQMFAHADELRPAILQATERQIGLGRAAFAQLAAGAEARAASHASRSITEHALT
ncbi:MAG: polysaccharide pyruvyl transferase family protein [Gemmatimonadetes bacterium]|nr:polysaccharide pyruvyl transferase family protein [Gemmatimonadota bacterium]